MATLNEITANIQNILSGGRSTQDTVYSRRQIAFFVRYYRHLLIRRDTDYWKGARELTQSLGSVSVEVSQLEAGRAGQLPSSYLRTTEDLPEIVRLRRRPGLTYVGSPDLRESYTPTVIGNARYQQYGRYTADRPRAFWHENRVYITSGKIAGVLDDVLLDDRSFSDIDSSEFEEDISQVQIEGIFARPEAAYSFRTGSPYDWDTEYPGMPEDMIQRINQSVISGEGKAMITQVLDTEADQLPVNQQPQDNEAAPAQ